MKKVRGSYMVEMVLVAGIMALLVTTALPTFTNALKSHQDGILASLDTVQPSSHVNKETAEKFSAQ
ncbi:type II secretion system protein [Vibrio parahaemolyticus]|nr:type II secretion system protein [Vibrio parahaemolyticus]EJE8512339.1 type II secretion system protein [Vibrio parahaemolyticus]EJE8771785.1 type II secretion system protein [Vibrio parahaemolyticus]MBM4945469.1 type II secretion system protein [Vibrio parahaemolyticus]MBM4947018.1 type II secretion system protein [Vibrio parahaemolyticus]